jgi:hypothetical protein
MVNTGDFALRWIPDRFADNLDVCISAASEEICSILALRENGQQRLDCTFATFKRIIHETERQGAEGHLSYGDIHSKQLLT